MLWQVVFQVLFIFVVKGMHILHDPFFAASTTRVSCIDYTNERFGRMINEGWRSGKLIKRKILTKRSSGYPVFDMQQKTTHLSSKNAIENLIPTGDYFVKEHAKLVHDINSLRQVVFIMPFAEENKDYDDSIYHEIIEASPTSAPGQSFTNPIISPTKSYATSSKGNEIPIILIGGASQRQVVKSQPITFAKPTVNLIGTTISPLVKHPYPFVIHRKPVKICVTALPPIPSPQPTTKTLWERLTEYFIPRKKF